MREYTFIRTGGDKKIIEARSLKKALAKYSKPSEFCLFAVIYWTSKKGNESKKVVQLPYKTRKERKGRL